MVYLQALCPPALKMRAVLPHRENYSSQIRRAIYWQAGVLFVLSLLAGALNVQIHGWAMLYGGGTALVNTGLLAWRLSDAKRAQETAQQSLQQAYRSGFERLLMVASLLVLGMKLLELNAFAVLAGFTLGQLAWLAAMAASTRKQIKN